MVVYFRTSVPIRSCTQVGPGDYVLTCDGWTRITSNTAHRRLFIPRSWTITTEDGRVLGVFDCLRYARAGDLDQPKNEVQGAQPQTTVV